MGRRAFAVLALLVSSAGAGEIGIYARPDCSGCEITFPPFGSVDTLYVGILNSGDPPVHCGQPLYGGAFRIDGMPADWVVLEARPTPSACFVYGDPLGQGASVNLCLEGASSERCIPLYTLVVVTYVPHADVHLRVAGGWPCFGSDPCPMIYTGDQPCDPTCQCYPGGELIVNPVDDRCTVGVEARSWSGVRGLFRGE